MLRSALAQKAQAPAAQPAPAAPTPSAGGVVPSTFFPYEKMTVRKNAKIGSETRPILKGKLATGEAIESHATMLPPGKMPHPPHQHQHSEMWLIRQGTVELTINGKTQRLGPGSAAFVESNELHGIKNVGKIPARYFVVAMGPGSDK
jgi:mannose-6-phosphate isomerase-like protein (cupin superfamily)